MSDRSVRLHARLYRARSVDEAIALHADDWEGSVTRRRDGDYHVLEVSGGSAEDAHRLLGEVADAALVLTAEREKS